MNKRIQYLDGLRGIACICVYLNHFLLTFYPATYLGAGSKSHFVSGFDIWLAQSPLNVFQNGNFMVYIFFAISSFVISYPILKNHDYDKLSNSMLKRYFRLCMPVLVVCFIIMLFTWFSLFTNIQLVDLTGSSLINGRYDHKLTFTQFLTSGFALIWFQGDETFSNAFWMLKYLFLGGFISMILSLMAGKRNRNMLYLYGFLSAILLYLNSLYILFVFGTALAYFLINRPALLEKIRTTPLYICLNCLVLVLALFLGGYPTGVEVPTNIYSLLNHLPSFLRAYEFYHMLGAAMLIWAIVCLPFVERILSARGLLKLGNISFAIYLINLPMIFSFSTTIFQYIYNLTASYHLTAAVTFALSTLLLILLSTLFHKYVEKNCDKLVDRFLCFFSVS